METALKSVGMKAPTVGDKQEVWTALMADNIEKLVAVALAAKVYRNTEHAGNWRWGALDSALRELEK